LIADTLGRRYRIAHLAVGDHGLQPPPMPRMRAAVMAAEAAPAPLEGGESRVSVHVSGRIELLD
ncbi:MAG: cyclic nucleotide-binding protein, partial [Thauera sp.]|nr:cyclic nucleotide-binding protein [Thauera sp.]